jgi:phosphatidylserine/phosphatidylglycerophosphate/cardiolipin synthase-like enzyme
VIIDGRTLIVTSANFTTSDIHGDFSNPNSLGNANNLLKIDSPKLAALFTQEFNLMWGDGPRFLPDSKFGLKKPFRLADQVQLGKYQYKGAVFSDISYFALETE